MNNDPLDRFELPEATLSRPRREDRCEQEADADRDRAMDDEDERATPQNGVTDEVR